jgi:exodeoxyribonuclease V beta subunit
MRQPEPAAPLLDWAPVVEALVSNVLDTLLDEAGTLRLRDIALTERLNELEFHYPIARLDASALRVVLSSFDDHRGAGDGLTFEPTRGLMRGFIDLVFRHAGRFYIVDYKSNHLGARLEAYAREGLRQAIQQHRYDLQYLLYTLALHRYLRQRVASYDYDRHFGGVYYLFLRGMRAAEGPRYGVWYDRPPRRLIERLDVLFGTARQATP